MIFQRDVCGWTLTDIGVYLARICVGNLFWPLGAISKSHRENGISVIMRTRNDEEWLDLSLLSIKEFADEIIIIDRSSTNSTSKIVNSLVEKNFENITFIDCRESPLVSPDSTQVLTKDRNEGLKRTHFRNIVLWGPDVVAKTSEKHDIRELRSRILNLNPKIPYVVFLPLVNLDGDLFHQQKNVKISDEARCATYSHSIRFINTGRLEVFHIPLYFKPIHVNEIHAFHLNTVKSAKRLLFRHFWSDWNELGDNVKFPNLDDYIKYRIKKDWGINNFDDAAKYYVRCLCKSLVPYNKQKFGNYPDLLRDTLRRPKYRVIYEHGEIVGRDDVL